MRISIVGPAPPLRGGISQHTASLADAAMRRGHDVQILSYRRLYPALFFPGRSQHEPEGAAPSMPGLPTTAAIDSLDPRTWIAAGRQIASRLPGAVVLERWHPFFAPALATIAANARRAGARIVWMVHNARPHEGAALLSWRPLLRLGMHAEDLYLTHAQSQARAIEALGLHPTVKVLPLPSQRALPPRVERTIARRSLGVGEDEIVFLFFGHVREYKGVDVFLDALSRLPAAGPAWRALVVGEWYIDRRAADAIVSAPPLAGRVTIEDRFVAEAEIARYFGAATAIVLPYREGTQSGVVAMSHALDRPVIATDVGGLAEAIEVGATGLVVPRGDAGALAEALEQVRRGRRFSSEAIARAHAAATWERLVEAVEGVAGARSC